MYGRGWWVYLADDLMMPNSEICCENSSECWKISHGKSHNSETNLEKITFLTISAKYLCNCGTNCAIIESPVRKLR